MTYKVEPIERLASLPRERPQSTQPAHPDPVSELSATIERIKELGNAYPPTLYSVRPPKGLFDQLDERVRELSRKSRKRFLIRWQEYIYVNNQWPSLKLCETIERYLRRCLRALDDSGELKRTETTIFKLYEIAERKSHDWQLGSELLKIIPRLLKRQILAENVKWQKYEQLLNGLGTSSPALKIGRLLPANKPALSCYARVLEAIVENRSGLVPPKLSEVFNWAGHLGAFHRAGRKRHAKTVAAVEEILAFNPYQLPPEIFEVRKEHVRAANRQRKRAQRARQ